MEYYEPNADGVPRDDAAAIFFRSEGLDAAGNKPMGTPAPLTAEQKTQLVELSVATAEHQGKAPRGFTNNLRRDMKGDALADPIGRRHHIADDNELDELRLGGKGSEVTTKLPDGSEQFSLAMAVVDADADNGDVRTFEQERVLDEKLNYEREYAARYEWIDSLRQPVATEAERLRRIAKGLTRLSRARSEDERAVVAACVFGDMEMVERISTKHRIDLIAYTIRDVGEVDAKTGKRSGDWTYEVFGRSVRTAYEIVKRGKRLLSDYMRCALPPVVLQTLSDDDARRAAYRAVKRAAGRQHRMTRDEIEAAVARTLYDTAFSITAFMQMSARDQITLLETIHNGLVIADMAHVEMKDGGAGLSCAEIDGLAYVDKLDNAVCRQLATIGKHERKRQLAEFITDKVTGRREVNAERVRGRLAEWHRHNAQKRKDDGRQIARAIARSRKEAVANVESMQAPRARKAKT